MPKKKVFYSLFAVIINSVLSILLINAGFTFLGILILAGLISSIFFTFVLDKNTTKQIKDLYQKSGYISYLISIIFIFITIFLYEMKIIGINTALLTIFIGTILIMPIVALLINKKEPV